MQQSSAIYRARQLTSNEGRYVDLGILVKIVRQNSSGIIVKHGKPNIEILREHRLGGVYDTWTREIVSESKNPIVWFVSEIQWRLINHECEESRILCFGAEGAGKSYTLSCYLALTVIKTIGHSGNAGCTAPTSDRLRTLIKVLRSVIPIDTPHDRKKGSWGTYHSFGGPGEIRFVTGLVLHCRPTHIVSSALGSPIQGHNWLFCISDEIQDTVTENGDLDGDIEARLRAAIDGKSTRFCTATAKDSAKFRDWKGKKQASPDWTIERMPYFANWAVWPEHWETMRRNLSDREWKRRCLAMDLPPENAVYHAWDRENNLIDIPEIGARDVTKRIMKRFGSNISILIGHDPGTRQDVSVLLKAYHFPGDRLHRWIVIDELTTKGTSEHHADRLQVLLNEKYSVNLPGVYEDKALVRCDPYSDSANKTDRSIYVTFKLAGFDMRSAQYDSKGRGKGIIHREARIEMVNRLLCNAKNERRLFVAKNSQGLPVARKLINSLESSERDFAGKAENVKKGRDDLTHWTAALGYALWPTEKIYRATKTTNDESGAQWV